MTGKIEAGCLAIVVGANFHTENIGKTASLLHRHEDEYVMHGYEVVEAKGKRWVVEVDGDRYASEERHLLRIDDYDESQDVTESDKELAHDC